MSCQLMDVRTSNAILDPLSFIPYRVVDIKLKVAVEAVTNFRGDINDIYKANCEYTGKLIAEFLYEQFYAVKEEKKNEVSIIED